MVAMKKMIDEKMNKARLKIEKKLRYAQEIKKRGFDRRIQVEFE